MGAWDYNIFDDDSTCDFAAELAESEDPVSLFEETFQKALESGYLECDEAASVLVSAAGIDSLLNKTKHPDETEVFREWVDANEGLSVTHLKKDAVSALERILADDSELNELWSENEELYPKWREVIEQLTQRLQ